MRIATHVRTRPWSATYVSLTIATIVVLRLVGL